MFKPYDDRLDYGKLLAPPDGYQLDYAVGTTYSLDLKAFVGACLSLAYGEDTESEIVDSNVAKIAELEVLRKTSDKIALFCETGAISVPTDKSPLYVLLEKCVQQVLVKSNDKKYASFHPKFWLISYVKKQRQNESVKQKDIKKYRMIVLSRNLTFDRSWDVAVSLDGSQVEQNYAQDIAKNTPIKDFLRYLYGTLPNTPDGKAKKERIDQLVKELDYVKFDLQADEFSDFEFLPIGFGNYSIRNDDLFNKKYNELLVMSPFLTASTIKQLNDNMRNANGRPALFTRRKALEGLKSEHCGNFDIYCMRSEVIDGEEESQLNKQDIHAKLYMWREYCWSTAQLYLGSMNCTAIATSGIDGPLRNIECLVKLTSSKRKYLDLFKLKEQLFCGDENDDKNNRNPFEKVCLEDISHSDGEQDERLDGIIKSICDKLTAKVVQNGEKYNIEMKFNGNIQPNVTLSPLYVEDSQELSKKIVFENIVIGKLSEFYEIKVQGKEKCVEKIIKIDTQGIPNSRESAVVSSIISDKNTFYSYLAIILEDNMSLASEISQSIGLAKNSGGNGNIYFAQLYEKMLKVAVSNPKKFESIDYLMDTIGKKSNIVPDKFKQLYGVFKEALSKGRKGKKK